MAIGVRITSENLMGQNVDVTFFPMNGSGPIHLGEQTIPFNYYNDVPYGEYKLNSILYDYEYSLNIKEPFGQKQNYSRLGNISGQTNYCVASLNFEDVTAEIIDLGVDSIDWSLWSWRMITESGYAFVFSNNSTNEKLVLFTDINLNIVEQYNDVMLSYDFNTVDGKYCYFIDNTNGVFKYFNGVSVYDYTFDPLTERMDLQYDWDGVSLDGTLIFIITNTSTNTRYSYKMLSNGSVLPITNWDGLVETRYYGLQISSNYFYEISYSSIDNSILSLRVYDTSGNEYPLTTFAPNTYYSFDIRFYGDNSFNFIGWDESNDSTDYVIINFDGNNENVLVVGHPRGTNYKELQVWSDSTFWPLNNNNGGIFMFFYGNTDSYKSGAGYSVDYCDIVFKLNSDDNLTKYVYTDTGDFTKFIEFNVYYGGYEELYTFCSTGDGYSSILTITKSGIEIIPTSIDLNNITYVEYLMFGDYYSYIVYQNSLSDLFLCRHGILVDSKSFNSSSLYFNRSYKTFYIGAENSGYYLNENVTGLTSTNFYNNIYTPWSFYLKSYNHTAGNIVLFNYDTNYCRVLTTNNMSNEFFLPYNNGNYEIRVGRDKFLYVYNDNSNNTKINLYNFDGALLQSVNSIPDWNDVYAGKDRYVVEQYDNDGQKLITMLTEDTYKQVTIDNEVSSWSLINDYILWD